MYTNAKTYSKWSIHQAKIQGAIGMYKQEAIHITTPPEFSAARYGVTESHYYRYPPVITGMGFEEVSKIFQETCGKFNELRTELYWHVINGLLPKESRRRKPVSEITTMPRRLSNGRNTSRGKGAEYVNSTSISSTRWRYRE